MSHFLRPRFFTLYCTYAACLLSCLWLTESFAQTYPTRTIRLIVPYAAGGGTDVLGRGLAQKLSEALGQSVIVENRPGADGMIGSEALPGLHRMGTHFSLTQVATASTPRFILISVLTPCATCVALVKRPLSK